MVADIHVDLRPLILVVEDNPHDVELLKLALSDYGERIAYQWAENTVSALNYLGKRGRFQNAATPDLILLDLKLPIYSGHDLLRDIAQDDRWRTIPVIVLSSSHRDEDIERSYREGAMLYVIKPGHWDRWTDLATSFAKLVGLAPDEVKPPTGRITKADPPSKDPSHE
jgi:CheY-like chemotaxis protein